jgi:hypothetical protein
LNKLGLSTAHFPCDPWTQAEIYRHCRDGNRGLRLTVLERFDAITDSPVCCFYKDLDISYPNSKFILTVRQKQSWLRSCERYWKEGLVRAIESVPDRSYIEFIDFVDSRMYGTPTFDEQLFADAYDHYLEDVTTYFEGRSNDILVLNICGGDGWPELCRFLGAPEPALPFPRENRSLG